MRIWFNDEPLQCAEATSVADLLTQLEQQQPGVALALNQRILPRERWEDHLFRKAIKSCFFRLSLEADMLRIADKTFESHLFTGTGKFAAPDVMVEAIRASGSQLVTLAMKRRSPSA